MPTNSKDAPVLGAKARQATKAKVEKPKVTIEVKPVSEAKPKAAKQKLPEVPKPTRQENTLTRLGKLVAAATFKDPADEVAPAAQKEATPEPMLVMDIVGSRRAAAKAAEEPPPVPGKITLHQMQRAFAQNEAAAEHPFIAEIRQHLKN